MLVGALGVAGYATYLINQPRPRTWRDDFSFTPFELDVPSESVTFRTDDGLAIRGWLFPREETNRVIVCCTGHRGSKPDLLGIGSSLWRNGFNVLLFDFRGCGDSDPSPISLAHHEVNDARAAVRFVSDRVPGAEIGMLGYSMGAAVAILVAASDPTIRAVVADSSFTSIRDVVAYRMGRHRLPPPVVPLADIVNRWRYGYPFSAVRPIDVVGRISPRPLAIIHGAADDMIPVDHAHELFAAAGEPKELWIVPETRHCGAYFRERAEYVERVTRFFQRALPGVQHVPATG
jgi:alpha-beta hydrolase superfamily lysophospholipase